MMLLRQDEMGLFSFTCFIDLQCGKSTVPHQLQILGEP
uniref:Uncharacterized protein n=1 Tax=Anguilla anguilla TaxID=7936 RepID=A0A0E9TQU8_ANGAN